MKNKLCRYLLGTVLGLLAMQLAAQPYPNKPISLVVPQAAGGTNDIVDRMVAPPFGEAIGASVVVENRPGAGGNIGTQGVARAAKDGYTLLLMASQVGENCESFRRPA